MKEKLKKIPIIREVVKALEHIKLPGTSGFSFYSLIEMYLLGIIRGAFSARAGSISFSFFMALFPFLLFVLNLIPFVPFVNFDGVLLEFIETLLPKETHIFSHQYLKIYKANPEGGCFHLYLFYPFFLLLME